MAAFVVKAGDDLRQEYFAMSIIKHMSLILEEKGSGCWLRPYNIVMLSANSGFVEYLWDTKSIDAIKRICGCSLKEIFHHQFLDNFKTAQENFARSLAGYSLVCYVLGVKDRHNGNILIDEQGHVVHIDYGFILDTSPGNAGFESAPFKFTDEYMELLGPLFKQFADWFAEGLVLISRSSSTILSLCQLLARVPGIPCQRFN
jgi:phosphatidylinositol kinase/protein kinase (PI-3  family)